MILRLKVLFYILIFSLYSGNIRDISAENSTSLKYIPFGAAHLTRETGLPHFDMDAMVQDRLGFLYFSTWGKGLYRYAGRDWEQFTMENSGLMDNRIVHMVYDGDETIYIAHLKEGITRFNIFSGTGEKLPLDIDRLNSRLSRLHLDEKNNLCVLTSSGGLYYVNLQTGKSDYLSGSSARLKVFDAGWQNFDSAFVDSRGTHWFGTEKGAVQFAGEDFQEYYPQAERRMIRDFGELPDGTLLVFCDRFIGYIDRDEKKIKPYTKIVVFTKKLETFKIAPTECFVIDRKGRYILFTSGGGVVYNPQNKQSFELNEENRFLVNNYVNNVFEDREGTIWVTTGQGISKLQYPHFYNIHRIEDVSVSTANINPRQIPRFKNNYNDSWLYFPEEQFIAWLKGNEYIRLNTADLPANIIQIFRNSGKTVLRLYNTKFYGSEQTGFTKGPSLKLGYSYLENDGVEYRLYTNPPYNHGLRIKYKDSVEYIKIPRSEFEYYRTRIYFANKEKTKLLILQPLNRAKAYIFDIETKTNSRVFFEAAMKTGQDTARDREFFQIAYDGDGGFWISYNNPTARIVRYNNGKYTDYTSILGVEKIIIEDMKSGPRHRLFLATANEGLWVFDGDSVQKYTTTNGLANNRLTGGISVSHDGTVYVLSNTALSIFNDQENQPPQLSPVFFRGEDIADKSNSVSLLRKKKERYFVFQRGLRNITLYLGANSFLAEKDLEYSFYLPGRMDEWTGFKNDNFINLTNLVPGNYKIQARVRDHFSREEETLFLFQIPPFWYEMSFFRILILLIGAGVLYFLFLLGIKLNTRRIQTKSEELEKLVEKRTGQLKESQKKITQLAYLSGKAEIAVEILHNAGNLLNTINSNTEQAVRLLKDSKINSFIKANEMLDDDRISDYFTMTEKGAVLRDYYVTLGETLAREKKDLMHNIKSIRDRNAILHRLIMKQEKHSRIKVLNEPIDLRSIAGEIINSLQGKQLEEIDTVMDTAPSVVIKGQKVKIITILISIYSNAIEAVRVKEDGEKKIYISFFSTGPKGGMRIKDTGLGIKRENLKKIFNFGYSTKEEAEGSSLHSCANFMTEMNGSISVESEGPGKGSTFILEWPLWEHAEKAKNY